jgi:glucokinase
VLRSRGEVTAEGVFEAAKAGDPVALKVADETAFYLATACISLSRVLDPDLFVFAGGMALAGEFLFDRIRAHIRAQDWSITPWRASIVGARLGNDAGFIGAAAVAWDWQLMAREQVQSA